MSEDPTPAEDGLRPTPAPGGETPADRNGAAAGSWARLVELEREARFLSAKCDDLRHSCRDLLAAIDPPGPLTDEQVRSIQSDPPRRSRDEVYAEYYRLREEKAAGLPVPPKEHPAGRIAELEQQVAALTARRVELREAFLALVERVVPFEPLSVEELWDMLHGPRGRPLIEIIEECERELNG
jgi:hypothetical protein